MLTIGRGDAIQQYLIARALPYRALSGRLHDTAPALPQLGKAYDLRGVYDRSPREWR
jgi:hypothetical protein